MLNKNTTMKQLTAWIVLLSGILSGCTENYRVLIQETHVRLLAPASGATFDLNDLNEEYRFSWEPDGQPYMLVLSRSPYLLDPYAIEAGDTGNYTIDYRTLDQQLALFNQKAGETEQFYWSVKPSGNLKIAASEIFPLTIKRLESRLNGPADRYRLSLNCDEPDTPCTFSWESEGLSEADSYELVFATNPQFEQGAVDAFDTDDNRQVILTHAELQMLIDALDLDPFNMNTLYWNVRNKSTGEYVSLAPATLLLDGMLIFTDPRDGEVYRVTKLTYSDGEEVIWFADNYRGTRFTDGRELGVNDVLWPTDEELLNAQNGIPVPEEQIEAYRRAYGGHYRFEIRNDIAPEGWHLATNEEFVKLFNEAALAEGGVVVLKDPVYYAGGIQPTDTNVNAWRMNMTAAGRYLEWGEYIAFNREYANFHIATLPSHMQGKSNVTLLHDGGSQLWYPEQSSHAPVRFVYGNP